MRFPIVVRFAALALLSGPSCSDFDPSEFRYACQASSDCLEGWQCASGVCVAAG